MIRFIIFVFFLLLSPVLAHGQDETLNILYTGSINGELEPCGCSPKSESGGLARLSGFISSQKKGLSPYLLIDAGNSMAEDSPQGRFKAEAILKAFSIMDYDVAAFLKHEAAFHGDFLLPLAKKNGVPVISGLRGSSRTASFERGPFKINASVDPGGLRKGRLNILLTDKPVSDARAIRHWDVIITSSGEELEEPVKVNGTVIVSGYPRNKKLGILTLSFGKKGITKATHRWQSLGREIEEDAEVRGVLKEYDSRVAGLLKEDEKKAASGGQYAGAVKCAECHKPFSESWEKTRHAGAFDSLVNAGKSKDPECVKCHTVGFGEEGGFYSAVTTPQLKDVQCEACHGPGRDHAQELTPLRPVTEQACLRCHTKSNSPDFDFKLYHEKIKH
ncbi:MAG: hypothetical protein HY954_12190 [Deltaproteobacteria bacterium]|nr:hypothetical protein [Deltaproteobacteria bacterium]